MGAERGREAPGALAMRVAALPRPLLLALDVDGTLAPIVKDPARARVPAGQRAALRALVAASGVRVALVTGRDATSLSRVIRLPGAYRALSHGRTILAPGERASRHREGGRERALLAAFGAWARKHALGRGGLLERKDGARALHVRALAARDPLAAEALLRRAHAHAASLGLRSRRGRAVLEVELEPADKGEALALLARRARCRGVLYAGDDLTDLPAIRWAVARGGLGVFVRSAERPRAPRGASATLDGSEAVRGLLEALAALLARSRR